MQIVCEILGRLRGLHISTNWAFRSSDFPKSVSSFIEIPFSNKFQREVLSSQVWSICNKSEGTTGLSLGLRYFYVSSFSVWSLMGFLQHQPRQILAPTWCTEPLTYHPTPSSLAVEDAPPPVRVTLCVFTSTKLLNTYTRRVQGLIYLVNRCQCHTSHAILVRLPSRHLVSTCAHCSLRWSPRSEGPTDDSATIHHISAVLAIA